MFRFAFSEPSIGSTITRSFGSLPNVSRRAPRTRDGSPRPPPRGASRGAPRSQPRRPRRRPSCRRRPCPPDDRLALVPARHAVEHLRTSPTAARQSSSQGSRVEGWKSSPETSFG
jgi:hypothetical protein